MQQHIHHSFYCYSMIYSMLYNTATTTTIIITTSIEKQTLRLYLLTTTTKHNKGRQPDCNFCYYLDISIYYSAFIIKISNKFFESSSNLPKLKKERRNIIHHFFPSYFFFQVRCYFITLPSPIYYYYYTLHNFFVQFPVSLYIISYEKIIKYLPKNAPR